MNFNKITTGRLLLILGLIIIIIPPLLVSHSFFEFLNFSDKGQIGDTIGGLTSPFINAIGAVLVFIAFKEQVKSNDLIKEQQYFEHIQEQIHRLEDDFLDLPSVINGINKNLQSSSQLASNFTGNQQTSYSITSEFLNKVIYTTSLFQQTDDLINKMENNKEFMHKKLKILYKIIYQDNYIQLDTTLKRIMPLQSKSSAYVAELLFQIKDLEEKFGS